MTDNYNEWHQKYIQQGALITEALGQIIFKTMESSDLEEARKALRQSRNDFKHKFCLLLYASGTDEQVATNLVEIMGDPLTQDEFRNALDLASHTSTSQVLTVIMTLLDRYKGIHLLLLERPNEEPPDGPIRIRTPDSIWFESFKLVAELAQAIIVIGDFGYHLIQEINYLGEAGLRSRVLVYVNGNLYSFKGDNFEELDKWSVAEVDKAVEYAATQPAG